MRGTSFPSNVHVSAHPCLEAKLSQLRSKSTNARETKALVHEIAVIVGCEALAKGLKAVSSGTVSFFFLICPQMSTTWQQPREAIFRCNEGEQEL